jgi:hypothetical protein
LSQLQAANYTALPDLHPQHFTEAARNELLHEPHDAVSISKCELHVQLRELRLPVCAQVLISEAARDLVVAVVAGHHEHLLEQLRALRQRVPITSLVM